MLARDRVQEGMVLSHISHFQLANTVRATTTFSRHKPCPTSPCCDTQADLLDQAIVPLMAGIRQCRSCDGNHARHSEILRADPSIVRHGRIVRAPIDTRQGLQMTLASCNILVSSFAAAQIAKQHKITMDLASKSIQLMAIMSQKCASFSALCIGE